VAISSLALVYWYMRQDAVREIVYKLETMNKGIIRLIRVQKGEE
jgi:hypothetical protein